MEDGLWEGKKKLRGAKAWLGEGKYDGRVFALEKQKKTGPGERVPTKSLKSWGLL